MVTPGEITIETVLRCHPPDTQPRFDVWVDVTGWDGNALTTLYWTSLKERHLLQYRSNVVTHAEAIDTACELLAAAADVWMEPWFTMTRLQRRLTSLASSRGLGVVMTDE